MYLSRLLLNPRSLEVCRDLGDINELHRTILKAFPDLQLKLGQTKPTRDKQQSAREEFGVLHRLEPVHNSNVNRLLVQSKEKPNWTLLPHDYFYNTGGRPTNPAVKDVDDAFHCIKPGMELSFRLCANPTRRTKYVVKVTGERTKIDNPHGHRVVICGEKNLLQWLNEKGKAGGFRLLSARINGNSLDADPEVWGAWAKQVGVLRGWRPSTTASNPTQQTNRLTLKRVMFEGRLRVTDDVRFLGILCKGIGSGKAYGCGLLSVAPSR